MVSNFGEQGEIGENTCARMKLVGDAIYGAPTASCPPSFAHARVYRASCYLSSKLETARSLK